MCGLSHGGLAAHADSFKKLLVVDVVCLDSQSAGWMNLTSLELEDGKLTRLVSPNARGRAGPLAGWIVGIVA